MQRSRNFYFMVEMPFWFVVWLIFSQGAACAESVRGKFFNGQMYGGKYLVEDVNHPDGNRIKSVVVKLTLGEEKSPRLYYYIADSPPSVRAGNMGFLSIVVNSGGMEGEVTYNYVIPFRGKLISIGTVRTTRHLGKVESIYVRPNERLSRGEINRFIRGIVKFNPPALTDPKNAYSIATLILLGQGRFLTPSDCDRLSKLYANKEISDDPVLLCAIRRVIGTDPKRQGKSIVGSGGCRW